MRFVGGISRRFGGAIYLAGQLAPVAGNLEPRFSETRQRHAPRHGFRLHGQLPVMRGLLVKGEIEGILTHYSGATINTYSKRASVRTVSYNAWRAEAYHLMALNRISDVSLRPAASTTVTRATPSPSGL
jgi:hypothetical protein